MLTSFFSVAQKVELVSLMSPRSVSSLVSKCVGHYQGYTHSLGATQLALLLVKGKKAALDIVKADEDSRASIHRIGECIPPMREDLRKMEKFVCSLYNDVNCCKVNNMRYKLFCKNQNLQLYQLPPTHAALQKHQQRANYQAYVWKHALDARILKQGPDGQGWRVRG